MAAKSRKNLFSYFVYLKSCVPLECAYLRLTSFFSRRCLRPTVKYFTPTQFSSTQQAAERGGRAWRERVCKKRVYRANIADTITMRVSCNGTVVYSWHILKIFRINSLGATDQIAQTKLPLRISDHCKKRKKLYRTIEFYLLRPYEF